MRSCLKPNRMKLMNPNRNYHDSMFHLIKILSGHKIHLNIRLAFLTDRTGRGSSPTLREPYPTTHNKFAVDHTTQPQSPVLISEMKLIRMFLPFFCEISMFLVSASVLFLRDEHFSPPSSLSLYLIQLFCEISRVFPLLAL